MKLHPTLPAEPDHFIGIDTVGHGRIVLHHDVDTVVPVDHPVGLLQIPEYLAVLVNYPVTAFLVGLRSGAFAGFRFDGQADDLARVSEILAHLGLHVETVPGDGAPVDSLGCFRTLFPGWHVDTRMRVTGTGQAAPGQQVVVEPVVLALHLKLVLPAVQDESQVRPPLPAVVLACFPCLVVDLAGAVRAAVFVHILGRDVYPVTVLELVDRPAVPQRGEIHRTGKAAGPITAGIDFLVQVVQGTGDLAVLVVVHRLLGAVVGAFVAQAGHPTFGDGTFAGVDIDGPVGISLVFDVQVGDGRIFHSENVQIPLLVPGPARRAVSDNPAFHRVGIIGAGNIEPSRLVTGNLGRCGVVDRGDFRPDRLVYAFRLVIPSRKNPPGRHGIWVIARIQVAHRDRAGVLVVADDQGNQPGLLAADVPVAVHRFGHFLHEGGDPDAGGAVNP